MANILTDINDRTVRIGDKVKFHNGYVFTIEVIRPYDRWVWGSDLPTPYMTADWLTDEDDDRRNYHNSDFIELYHDGGESYQGSII
jgi:hypothetical protein